MTAADTQTKTLKTKTGAPWRNDLGQQFPAQTLYRFVDADGNGPGVWFGSIERAESSWERWVASAPSRARVAAENASYREAVAAHDARNADPFARLGD